MAPVAHHEGSAAPSGLALTGSWIGAFAAVLCSLTLAYWVAGSGRNAEDRAARRTPVPAVFQISSPPDPAQVRRAYDQVRNVYGEYGLRGVIAVADGCRNAVAASPAQLDFCVAFAADAAALAAASDDPAALVWSADAERQQLALIRGVVGPKYDPSARLERIRELTRTLIHDRTQARLAEEDRRRQLLLAQAERTRQLRTVHAVCRPHSAHERTLCAHPDLRAQDLRLKTAYRRALARSADRARMERVQAQWMAAFNAAAPDPKLVSNLYRIRIRELERLGGERPRRHRSELQTAEAQTSLTLPPY